MKAVTDSGMRVVVFSKNLQKETAGHIYPVGCSLWIFALEYFIKIVGLFLPSLQNTDSVLLLSYMQGWFKLNINEGMRKKVYDVRCLHTICNP